ncbi:MAG: hypothetical protein J1F67_00040 [Muribaculaceae bacterium]|nr:hypothetical protein [Muribaculaceae bacterium]
MYLIGYGLTPELALEDLRSTIQSIIDKEAGNSKSWSNEMKYLSEYYAEGELHVYLTDNSNFNLHFENQPESTPNTLNIVVEAPKDRFQQYMAWFLKQPEDLALITGTGNSTEEALKDLQETLQYYINGDFANETEMMLANKIVPVIQKSKFKVYKAVEFPFELNFDNIFLDEVSY